MVWLVAGWCGLVALAWLGGLIRAIRSAHDPRYRVGPEGPAAAGDVPVSIVIPARNEEAVIEACVAGALAQDHPSVEVVVLDDGSTDETAARLAAFPDVRVIEGSQEPLPEGWLGKPWACHRAAQHALGDWLLFVDADVRLAPEAVSRALAYAQEHELDLLSGLGQLENGSLGERILMPAVTGAILASNPLPEVNDPERPKKAFASGQFLLFRREAYEAIGGHRAVKDNVVDDVGLATAIKREGLLLHVVHMRALYRCRMYTSGSEAWAGWRKNLFRGIHSSWAILLLAGLFQLGFLYAPLGVLLAVAFGWLTPWVAVPAGLAVVSVHALRAYLDRVFGEPVVFGQLTHLLGNALFFFLLVDSAVATTRGVVTWKGRTV